LRGSRTVVRPRRALRGHRRLARRAAAASGWRVPAADAAQLRGGARRAPPREPVRRASQDHPRTRREPDATAAWTLAVPVSRRMLARLPVRRLLQHSIVDAAGRDGDGPPDARALLDR